MGSYIPNTPAQRQEMLAAIGVSSLRELYANVPEQMLLSTQDLKLPQGLSELEVRQKLTALAQKNRVYPTLLRGAGAYRHFIPSVVKSVASREEFVTAYTPYQAEISQGILQSIFEFQTMICNLTGMDVANASVYDGATAARPSPCAGTAAAARPMCPPAPIPRSLRPCRPTASARTPSW